MATVKYFIQSKSKEANIYIRFSINRETVLKRKTGFTIDAKDWSIPKAGPIQKSEELKKLKDTLDTLTKNIDNAYNNSVSVGANFTNDWLQLQIDIFNKKTPVVELDILTNYINKFIAEAPYKQNQKKEIGLSDGRIRNLRLFHNTIKRYEKDELEGKSIIIKEVNLQFIEKFKLWLFNKGYAVDYVGKNIANMKTICNDAYKNDIEVSTQLKNIKGVSRTRPAEEIIYLSEEEQETIKNVKLLREGLINARKWLLLGCLIGQRGNDLLNITEKNIKDLNGIKIIELKQQKTGKLVAIPLLPDALEIVESGLPYKISLAQFNEHLKDICEIAEINEPTLGGKKEKKGQPNIKKLYPKYKLIASHVLRRSFATNFYGKIPTPILMNITAHGTEAMFLKYIGKTSYDNAFQMLEYFSKLKPKDKQPTMELIRNTGN